MDHAALMETHRRSAAATRVRIFPRHDVLSYAVLALSSVIYLAGTWRHQLLRWDDAYITFRFAQHLAEGQGLVWNIGGERVEGYTSFLQVMLLALGAKGGMPPELGSVIISVASVFVTVAALTIILRRTYGQLHVAAAVVLGLYLVDEATAVNSTSGLETQLFVALLCLAYFSALAFLESPRWHIAILTSLLVFLSVLSRPEGVLYALAMYAVLLLHGMYLGRNGGVEKGLRYLGISAAALASMGAAYALWKYNYFGYLLPNPFYVKSNQFSLADAEYVYSFVGHFVQWYGPLLLCFVLVARGGALRALLRDSEALTRFLLILAPAILALAYYTTIIHEVGGAYRFSYPTYFFLALAVAMFVSWATGAARFKGRSAYALALVPMLYLSIPVLSGASWRITPLPPDDFMQYHAKIARALAETGLGSKATIVNDAAGLIPYVSRFSFVDPVGLTDNYLSGRQPVTPEERESYIWSRNADVYIGYEPSATAGAVSANGDPRMSTSYVVKTLLGRQLSEIEHRLYVQDRELLYSRMKELRDNWHWLGEIDWPGLPWLGLRAFVYVRSDSPYAETLIAALKKIISVEPDRIDLSVTA